MLTKTTESENVPAIVESLFRARETALTEQLEAVRESLQLIAENPKNIRFEVALTSHWANEGEKNVIIHSKKGEGLEKVLRQAVERFKEINNRSDVQAKWFVNAFVGANRMGVIIPEELIAHYRK